jgi:hypothetical protein
MKLKEVGGVEALLDSVILATIKPCSQAQVNIMIPLPGDFHATLEDPQIQSLALELAVVTRGRGFILTERGSKKVVGVGFTDEEIAKIYFNWLEAVKQYEAKCQDSKRRV